MMRTALLTGIFLILLFWYTGVAHADQWQELYLPTAPEPRTGHMMANLGGDVYLFGGENPENLNQPHGLVGFQLPCSTATVKVIFHGAASLERYTYRKFGPTPPDFGSPQWYGLPIFF